MVSLVTAITEALVDL